MASTTYQKLLMEESAIATLEVDLREDRRAALSPLLQRGVIVRLPEETTVSDFLCHHLGIEPEFVEQAITTIFLNGKPVDNLDQARLGNGDTLALSAAMPGLVGATMRRQGLVACFRSNISHREQGRREAAAESVAIVLKLFNLMVKALGPSLLAKGVLVGKTEWEDFLHSAQPDFWENCRVVKLNGRELHPTGTAPLPWPDRVGWINLKVKAGSGG
jgi:hypothetical protein